MPLDGNMTMASCEKETPVRSEHSVIKFALLIANNHQSTSYINQALKVVCITVQWLLIK
jgi:hypothetical protein